MVTGNHQVDATPVSMDPVSNMGALGALRMLLLVSVLLPLTLFGAVAWKNYVDVEERAIERTGRLVDSVREHALKVFETNEVLMGRVDDLLAGKSDSELRGEERWLHERMSSIGEGIPHVQAIWAWSADGKGLASNRFFPIPRELSIVDRQYYQVHRDGEVGAYVTEPLGGRISTDKFFNISRRRSSPDGQFTGLVAVSLRPDYFTSFYRRIADASQDLTITMVRDDGMLILRHPTAPEPGTVLSPESTVMQAIRSGRMGEPIWIRSQTDGTERLVTVQRIGSYPLYMAVGLPYQTILREWYGNLALFGIFAAAAAVGLFGTTWIALRRTMRERLAVVARDSEAKRREHVEEALRQSQKLEALGQLTGGVAHDFNNLLTVVIANLDLIDRRAERPTEVRRMAETAIAAASRGARLTQQLLAFARRQALRPEVVDVSGLLNEAAPLLRQAAGAAVRLEFALSRAVHHCRIDVSQFENAILNLVVNARDAMLAGGVVTIATGNADVEAAGGEIEPGRYLEVSVTDTGSGIPPEVLPRVFEPFFTTKDVGKGSGLGLSQVYGFVRQSGGAVRLESHPDRGTSVRLYLPRTDEEPAVQPAAMVAGSTPAQEDIILVVEDDEEVREVAVGTLRELGYRVLIAADGPQALDILRGPERIDLLFSDVVMPNGMDGAMLAREANRLRPGIRVLLTSGYTAHALSHEHGVEESRHPLLAKPYRSADLAAMVQEVLGRREADLPVHAARRLRVLLVEDEALVRLSTAEMLAALGHEALEAENAEDALRLLRTTDRIDLLLTDVGLPDMDGRNLALQAVDMLPGLPVIFATGYADAWIDPSGGTAVFRLAKPYNAAGLEQALAAVMQVDGTCEGATSKVD